MEESLLKLTDLNFPLMMIEHKKIEQGQLFAAHLHEHHLQIFYFIHGSAKLFCNLIPYEIISPQILLVNSGDLHYGEGTGELLEYFVFRIDLKLLASYRVSAVNGRYMEPIREGLVKFQQMIKDREIQGILNQMILECRQQQEGYELYLLSQLYQLLGKLIRDHMSSKFQQTNTDMLMKKRRRFDQIFRFIDLHYAESIMLSDLAERVHMSESYFCRTFKKCTGRTPMDYINYIRIEKSVMLLNQGICNVTEAAMSVGFDDLNYFSRVFKKYMKQSPSNYMKSDRKYFL